MRLQRQRRIENRFDPFLTVLRNRCFNTVRLGGGVCRGAPPQAATIVATSHSFARPMLQTSRAPGGDATIYRVQPAPTAVPALANPALRSCAPVGPSPRRSVSL